MSSLWTALRASADVWIPYPEKTESEAMFQRAKAEAFRKHVLANAISRDDQTYILSSIPLDSSTVNQLPSVPQPLIIIDMQDGFLNVDVVVSELLTDIQNTLTQILEQIRRARAAHMPIILIEYIDRGQTIEAIQQAVLGYDLLFLVTKDQDDATKTVPAKDRLQEILSNHASVRLAGINETSCVLSTAEGLVQSLQKTVVIHERHAASPNMADFYEKQGPFQYGNIGKLSHFINTNCSPENCRFNTYTYVSKHDISQEK